MPLASKSALLRIIGTAAFTPGTFRTALSSASPNPPLVIPETSRLALPASPDDSRSTELVTDPTKPSTATSSPADIPMTTAESTVRGKCANSSRTLSSHIRSYPERSMLIC